MYRVNNLRKKYQGISFSVDLLKRIDEILEENPHLEYSSRAEFIRCAIREKLETMHARGF